MSLPGSGAMSELQNLPKVVPLRNPSPSSSLPSLAPLLRYPRLQTCRILCGKRTGKQRYPSEKRKLRQKHKEVLAVVNEKSKFEGFWRLSKLTVSVQDDPGKDFLEVHDGLLQQIAKVIEFPVASMLPQDAFTVVRKSFDARKILKEPKFVYTVVMDVGKLLELEPRTWDFISRLEPKVGLIEHKPHEKVSFDLFSILQKSREEEVVCCSPCESDKSSALKKPKIGVVGSGPSGLFASLVLAELGADVTLIERGQPVEQRGRDIGALIVRQILQSESNFCFGEGGAGTWSDGKLVTRIGKNSDSVLAVLSTLVHFGAPRSILVHGKPHLGTDRLIPLLRNFRKHLQMLGVNIMFGKRVDDLVIEERCVVGVEISDSRSNLQVDHQKLGFDSVILAVGHSARDVYQMLIHHDVDLVPKDFSVGLRVEHPQELINNIQYSLLADEVHRGRGKVPVADYKVVNSFNSEDGTNPSSLKSRNHSCYSFCMCPGGQVVLTSTDPSEICINGMSFSRRSSRWANAALVVSVSTKDFEALNFHGPLAGVNFQRDLEQKASEMGGGSFVVPVQTVTDFMAKKLSVTSVPPSSYRLGVKAANLHELLPSYMGDALHHSISMFDKELPGFITKDALLHGVETRTSSPIQIPRSSSTYESMSLKGLYPVGEGAGYAGGIVSAAVDGMYAGFAAAKNLGLFHGDLESLLGKAYNAGLNKY